MALKRIIPFNFNTFKEMTKGVIEKIVSCLEGSEQGSWETIFKSYSWQGQTFTDGEKIRIDFNRKIRRSSENTSCVILEILEWGRMKDFEENEKSEIIKSLKILDNESTDDLSKIYAHRIASVSKIYDMWNPKKWIIYDSYCARGLQWVVKKFWETQENETQGELLRFPWPPGRSGGPIKGFPKVAYTAPRQAMLGSFTHRGFAD